MIAKVALFDSVLRIMWVKFELTSMFGGFLLQFKTAFVDCCLGGQSIDGRIDAKLLS